MKAKLFILFFLFFGVFSAIAQEVKIIEDSTKYTSYNVTLGDTITLEDTKVIVDKINDEMMMEKLVDEKLYDVIRMKN